MKPILFSLIVALLSACVTAARPEVRITLGKPNHKIEPPGSSIPGYESIEFPVRLTNSSGKPVWIYTQLRKRPSFSLYLRDNPTAPWRDETMPGCGLGTAFHSIAPGESILSSVWVPADRKRRQLRVEMPIYSTPDFTAKARNAASEATPIR